MAMVCRGAGMGEGPADSIRVLEGTREGLCRGCGAKLHWLLTIPNRKPMPFNSEPRIVQDTGCRENGARVLWVSTEAVHWGTCPKANRFRRVGRVT